jgi:tRNA threonylcarbamoyladenosine biosynthesis protein TsaB
MNILALESSAATATAALRAGESILAHERGSEIRRQAEELIPMAQRVLAASGLSWGDLDAVAAGVGPGAFTGIRIALAGARGIALASGIPAIGILSPAAVARAVPVQEISPATVIAVIADSKRGDFFVTLFRGLADRQILEDSYVASPASLADRLPDADLLLAGDAAEAALPLLSGRGARLSGASGIPDAADIAALAALELAEARRAGRPPAPARPLYLRPADAAPATGLRRIAGME